MNFETDSIMSMLPRPDEAEYAPHLEKDYCSNFICCGVPLADLHELVSHFEESHVTVVSSDGIPLPPGQPESPTDMSSPRTASSSALESPCSEYSSTPPPPNLFPTLTSAFQPRESAFTPVTTPSSRDPCANGYAYKRGAQRLPKEEQHVFDSMLHSEAYDCNTSGLQVPPEPYPHVQFCLPPTHVSPGPVHNSSVAPYFTTNHKSQSDVNNPGYSHPPTIAPTPVYARHPTLSVITGPQCQDQQRPAKRRREETQSWLSSREPDVPPRRSKKSSVGQKQPPREKAYKCPHTGCIKSYMNMNGLKYHLTKGACDYDNMR